MSFDPDAQPSSNFDPAPRARRVLVIGTCGAGKTTFARDLSSRLALRHIELDALFWLADWRPRAADHFRSAVDHETMYGSWIADGNYGAVRSILWNRATDVVWLNYSRTIVFARLLCRTLKLAITGRPLWAGNRETLARAFLSTNSVLLYALRSFGRHRRTYDGLRARGDFEHLLWHELRTPAEADALLREMTIDQEWP